MLWSKVFLDEGIANQTIGQSLRVDLPKSKPSLCKRKETLSIGGIPNSADSSIGFKQHGSMRTTVPSTRHSCAPVQSETLRLLTLWSAGSTPRLIH